MKLRDFRVAAGLGSLTATVALLAGLSGAHAQGAPGGGSFPGSILLPGTNTSFKVGGYAKFDYTYDFSQQEGIVGGSSAVGLALDGNATTKENPGHTVSHGSQMTASESRFNIETRTPTGYGEMKTLIEGDFTGPSGLTPGAGFKVTSNSTGFRLRLAYGTLGPFMLGQNASLFRDASTEAETLDFGGDVVAGVLRQPQARYTYDFGNGLTVAGAVENPQLNIEGNGIGLFGGGGTTFSTGLADPIPDFTGAIGWAQPWGHIVGRGVIRDLSAKAAPIIAPVTGLNDSALGWAIGLSGDYHTWGKDDIAFEINGGDGGGRYISDGANPVPDAVIDAFGNIQTIPVVDFMLNYQHWWTDTLRSNLSGGYARLFQPSNNGINFASTAAFNAQNRDFYTMHVNLIWSPVPQVDTGIEFILEQRKVENGLTGNLDRIQVSTKFKF